MRKTYIFDENSGKLVEGYSAPRSGSRSSITLMPDLPDFVSPIDKKVIHGRRGLREHNARHNVTNPSDYTNEWAVAAKKREQFFSGARDEGRTRAIAEAFQRHRNS